MRFFTAADLVSQLEKAQKQYTLDRFLGQLERAHLLICDELGYVSLSRGGVELLFRVFGDRYERASVLITSNLAVRRMEPDLPGRADDRGALGPPHAPLPHFRDEWRELSLSRVDETEEEPEIAVRDQIAVLAQNGHLQRPGGSLLDDQGGSILDDHFQ